MIFIREEKAGDIETVRIIHLKAFGQPQEADLVDKLRASCGGLLSLVAEHEEMVVGHILFSPSARPLSARGRAPSSV